MTGDGNTRASAVPPATTIARYDDQLSPPARTVAIVQSSYIPWKGYFDLIRHADHFILYDDAQYTSRDWRNRNRIKTKDGVMWLSIPVEVHGRRTQRVRDARVADPSWNRRHWKALATAYARAPPRMPEPQSRSRESALSDPRVPLRTSVCRRDAGTAPVCHCRAGSGAPAPSRWTARSRRRCSRT